ncbi:MAG: hypothetical protein QW416_09235 [Candidatus Nitrosocaldaceae archaeon]
MFEKINPLIIIKDHLNTLKDYKPSIYGYEKYNIYDILLFFIAPALITIPILLYSDIILVRNNLDILLIVFSIFTPLMFNILILLYNTLQKNYTANTSKLKIRLMKEIYYNVSYSIFISIVIIILLLVSSLFNNTAINNNILIQIIYGSASYFIINFFLTLFMVLKRIYSLLRKEFMNIDNANI